MSFVGSRSILEKEFHDYYTPEDQEIRPFVKSGMTWLLAAQNDAKCANGKRRHI